MATTQDRVVSGTLLPPSQPESADTTTSELLAVLPALERGEQHKAFTNMQVTPMAIVLTTTKDRASMRAAWARGENDFPFGLGSARRVLTRRVEIHESAEETDILVIIEHENGDVWMGLWDELPIAFGVYPKDYETYD